MSYNNIEEFREEAYKKLENSFVTYKQLTVVEEIDKNTDNERFSILPSTGIGVIGKYFGRFCDMENIMPNIIVRETVYKKLCRVDIALKQKNPSYQLVVTYGYRSLDIQKNLFNQKYNELKQKYDDPSELKEAVHRIIAAPEVAGHPTGGAVDVIIYDFLKKEYLDFGTEIHNFSTKKVYYDSPELKNNPDAKKNRKMLRSLMGEQDFVPYDGEWWHFSYGDKEWAYYKYRDNRRKKKDLGELKYKYSQKDFSEIFFTDIYTDKYKKVELITDEWIRLAIQKDGRLTEETLTMLKHSGIETNSGGRQFMTKCGNFPLELLFVRDDDIPNFVHSGVADLGIVGENVYYEAAKAGTTVLKALGFGRCALALAVPNNSAARKPSDLRGKRIATSYPRLTKNFFDNMDVAIQEPCFISGSVEIAPAINYADAIVDLVSSGASLRQHNLRFLQKIRDVQSVLVAHKGIEENNAGKWRIIEDFLARIESWLSAKKYKYIIMDVPACLLNETKEKLSNTIKKYIYDFNMDILDDGRLVKMLLLDITDGKDSFARAGFGGILPEIEKPPHDDLWEIIKNVIVDIKNDFRAPAFFEQRRVQTLVDTTTLWENRLKEIGAANIIVLDVERLIH